VANFRNYRRQDVQFQEGLNVISGANAQGKTNLLEAVYLCCVGRSARTPRDKELIMWGAESSKVTLRFEKRGGDGQIEIYLAPNSNKRLLINGIPISRIGELMGELRCVFFSPDELSIVKDGPSDRRRFLDISISQLSRPYFYLLGRYNKILSQRNKLLKGGDSRSLTDTLPVWDAQLAEHGAKIIYHRRKFIEKLSPLLKKEYAYLTFETIEELKAADGSPTNTADTKEEISIVYDGIDGETPEEIRAEFLKELEDKRNRDIKNGFTGAGPHKDDFCLKAGSMDLTAFGSQGQQRTAALSLKLAELEMFAAATDEYPILLLDDVMSELDLSRQARLLKKASTRGVQTLLTCTHLELTPEKFAAFTVENGKIIEY